MDESKIGTPPKPPYWPEEHVRVSVDPTGNLHYDRCCVHAHPGQVIRWHLDGRHAFAVIIKAFEGPLGWGYKTADRGETEIQGVVAHDARPGFYPYTLVAVHEDRLLVADPEIIIPPPRGGRA